MSGQGFETALIKAVAQKQGIPEAEASLYAEALKEDMGGQSNMERWMGMLAGNADTISRLPEGAQKDVINLLSVEAMSGRRGGYGDDEIDRSAKKLLLLKDALNPRASGDDATLSEIKGLREAVADLKTQREKEQFEGFKRDVLDKFDTRLDSIENQVKQVTSTTGAPGSPDALKAVLQRVEESRNTINGLRATIGLPPLEEVQRVAPEETPDQLKAKLEKAGYEVKGPLTREAMMKMFDEERVKIREETEARVKEEQHVTEKTIKMGMDVVQAFVDNVLPLIGEGQHGQGLVNAGRVLSGMAGSVAKTLTTAESPPQSMIDTSVG